MNINSIKTILGQEVKLKTDTIVCKNHILMNTYTSTDNITIQETSSASIFSIL